MPFLFFFFPSRWADLLMPVCKPRLSGGILTHKRLVGSFTPNPYLTTNKSIRFSTAKELKALPLPRPGPSSGSAVFHLVDENTNKLN
jgi:hypothetical protein